MSSEVPKLIAKIQVIFFSIWEKHSKLHTKIITFKSVIIKFDI